MNPVALHDTSENGVSRYDTKTGPVWPSPFSYPFCPFEHTAVVPPTRKNGRFRKVSYGFSYPFSLFSYPFCPFSYLFCPVFVSYGSYPCSGF
jgi:hypothetical protein